MKTTALDILLNEDTKGALSQLQIEACAELEAMKAELAAKDAVLRDMYALACELGEDDGFYFEQRNGMERVANAAQALKESEQE